MAKAFFVVNYINKKKLIKVFSNKRLKSLSLYYTALFKFAAMYRNFYVGISVGTKVTTFITKLKFFAGLVRVAQKIC